MRLADTTGPGDAGQLLQYYRSEKTPPGARGPSVWDEEEQDPATRLGEPEPGARGRSPRAAGYPGTPEGRPAPSPTWEDSERRLGPATAWGDHRYRRRRPSDINPGEEGGADLLPGSAAWPARRGYHAVSRMLTGPGGAEPAASGEGSARPAARRRPGRPISLRQARQLALQILAATESRLRQERTASAARG